MRFVGTEAPPRATAPTGGPTQLSPSQARKGHGAPLPLQGWEEDVLCPLDNCGHGRVRGPESQEDGSARTKWEEDDMEGGDKGQI